MSKKQKNRSGRPTAEWELPRIEATPEELALLRHSSRSRRASRTSGPTCLEQAKREPKP